MKIMEIAGGGYKDDLDKVQTWVYGWEKNHDGKKKWEKSQSRPDIELEGGKIVAHRDLDFSSDSSSTSERFPGFEYPFKFVDGHLNISYSDTDSLVGAPNQITASFYMNGCRIKSFEGAPQTIGGGLVIGNQEHGGLTSLKDIHKHFNIIRGSIYIGGTFTSNFLGLLMLSPSSIKYSFSPGGRVPVNEKTKRACEILDQILQEHGGDKKSVMIAQEKLIDADLDDYAEL